MNIIWSTIKDTLSLTSTTSHKWTYTSIDQWSTEKIPGELQNLPSYKNINFFLKLLWGKYYLWSIDFTSADIHLHALAEFWREGYTVEVLAVGAGVHPNNIKQHHQQCQQSTGSKQAQDDANDFPVLVMSPKSHVWQKSKGQQDAKKEAHQVGIVVDHGEEAHREEDEDDE